MYQRLLQILFGQDHRFLTLRTEGIPPTVQAALAKFWSDLRYRALAAPADLTPRDWQSLVDSLHRLATVRIDSGVLGVWREAAQSSMSLASTEPVAAALIALQALAAFVGALGDKLFFQPWQGHHPGWHTFPLIAARNLVAAEAIWAARFTCATASGFIESAKDAPFDLGLRGVIADYEAVRADAERLYAGCVDELAWALHSNAAAGEGSFRAELAALFWTAGDVLHADLLSADGPADYVPPYALVRALVDQNMATLPRAPLIQYIWLEMKDRGPFSLRGHRLLFGHINNVFHSHPLHELNAVFPLSVSCCYARAVITHMRGQLSEDDRTALFEAMAMAGNLVEARAPDVYLQIAALANLIEGDRVKERDQQWNLLANLSADVLRWADARAIFEPFDRVLDAPLYTLRVDSHAALEQTLDRIEAFRQANLGYWLSIAPPLHAAGRGASYEELVPADLLEEEQTLLRELRGARFIRMLPHLPSHYGRYGFRIDQALDGPPAGVTPQPQASGLLRFDPFDQNLAERNLSETRDRLTQLYERMRAACPEYAEARITPPSSAAKFVAALHARRG